ncbi:MAG TPA: hypothetical protein VMF31_07700 [Solirubrobacterales bacterium]|nr:hypothetical protein [Solirubrobacterales bacterium]
MTPLSIGRFRRLTFALIAVLFAGLAFNSIASADEFGTIKTKYKATVSGSYSHKWQTQTGDYPDPEAPWRTGTGKVTSSFSTDRPWKFVAVRYTNPPAGMNMPPFAMRNTAGNKLKAINTAQAKVTVNYVADCGGELGECDGDEREGTETSDRSCRRPKSKIPLEFEYDDEGRSPLMKLEFGQHPTMAKFCGDDFTFKNSIERLPIDIPVKGALDRIKGLNKGGSFSWKDRIEEGWIGDGADDEGPRYVKNCPKLGGKGTRHCWVTKLKFEIRRTR